MVTSGDYQSAKRWIIENLHGQPWYAEYEPSGKKGRGRKGVMCRIGPVTLERAEEPAWGGQ